ncbi:choice-of-anchor B family protein [Candidatus Palauibacter sp.]|uniref:choice-of-anchor B family protein n=1 Tax=Candidatus Palauibacter sp. TaxID=3101350 RepID=UPI003B01CE9F
MSVTIRDARGNAVPGLEVAWSSSRPDIATVDSSGLVTAAGNGEAVVTAAAGQVNATATVSVRQSAASALISPERLDLDALGDTVRISVTIRDARGNAVPGLEVAWSSSRPDIATVDSSGLVTAAGNGEAVVTAAAGQVNATATVSVRQSAASIAVSPDSVSFEALGDTTRLSATIRDARGNAIQTVEVAWSSSDTTVATVDAAGLVTSTGNGQAAVTARSGGTEASVPVSVRQSAASTAISPDRLSFEAPGDTARLSATVRDALDHAVHGAEVAWSVSDPTVAIVDATGLVTAIGRGEATVTATSGEANATVPVAVRQSARTIRCIDGRADNYPCEGVDLLAHVPTEGLRPGRPARDLNDIWGWTDPVTGTEYALVGRTDGLAIVDLADPWGPRPLAFLPSPTAPSLWRDVKVYADHAYVVADAATGHGVQILDLTRLRDLDGFTQLRPDGRYGRVSSVHNIAINEETGFAYLVGSAGGGETCGGGLHMLDLADPKAPAFAGCHATPATGWRGTGYTHDVQCVVYRGPDAEHAGREICVGSNETAVVVSDVTDRDHPTTLSAAHYPGVSYAHQGWLDEDHRFFYLNDELDEYYGLVSNSRLLVWDLTDLDDPVLASEHYGPTEAIDHNIYVRDDILYHSNYNFGIRILDISTRASPAEAGFFDTVPETNIADFLGSWSNYPYFDSGILIVSSMREGLFVLRLQR